MTAHELIGSIFARPQRNVAANMRWITADQWKYLTDLIGADEEGGATRSGPNGGLVWMPSGRWKYVLSYEPRSERRSLMKLANVRPSAAGTLFE
ncbi:MAG: hypothetical protein KGL39_18430 [Patescibacteria group bacterium]|nr:hypothetical protein [Patescibacteria group bacterium]